MVSKNSTDRPVRTIDKVVGFDFGRMRIPKPKPKKGEFKSDVAGVHWHKRSRKWQASPRYNNTDHYLGMHPTKEEAEAVVEEFRADHPYMSLGEASCKARMKSGSVRNAGSKYKGVYWKTSALKYVATHMTGGKIKHLGYHHSETEAALAYDEAAYEAWGDECFLNHVHFPEDFK